MHTEYFKVGNDFKIALLTLPINTVSVGIAVPVGASHETKGQHGIAHLLEHMTFAGTTSKDDSQIDRHFEELGAVYNAYTNFTETVYYAHGSGRHAVKLLQGVLDIHLNSTFPDDMLEREKKVVYEELQLRAEDKPGRKTYLAALNLLFDGIHERMQHEVIGAAEDINRCTRKDLIEFRKKHYKESYLVVAGSFDKSRVLKTIEDMVHHKVVKWNRKFDDKQAKLEIPFHGTLGKTIHIHNNINQTQVSFYFRSISYMSKWVHHISVISYVLTGNLNSMLNFMLRKVLGATYTTESYQVLYRNTGYFVISFSCNNDKVKQCVDATLAALEDIKQGKIDPGYLTIVKNQRETQNMFTFENFSNYFDFMVDSLLTELSVPEPKNIMKRYNSITVDEITQIAKKMFAKENMLLITEGPV
jgi:predicted Zn-dependent peptidase